MFVYIYIYTVYLLSKIKQHLGSVANSILDSILYIIHQCFIYSTLNIKKRHIQSCMHNQTY